MVEFAAEKRLAFMGGGSLMAIIAIAVLAWQTIEFFSQPHRFAANGLITIDLSTPDGTDVRDKIYKDPNFIYSEEILLPVVYDLDLNHKWGSNLLGDDNVLKSMETYGLLSNRIMAQYTAPQKPRILVTIYSGDRKEVTNEVNDVLITFREHFQKGSTNQPVKIDPAAKAAVLPRTIRAQLLPCYSAVQALGVGIFLIFWGARIPKPV